MPIERVGPELLTNAVSLNNINFNVSRVFGPALAGFTIRQFGISPCFLLNGITYGTVVIALLMLRKSELHIQPRQARARRQVREGLRYVWRTPQLRVPVILMFVVGMLTTRPSDVARCSQKTRSTGGAERTALHCSDGYRCSHSRSRLRGANERESSLLLRVTVVLGVFMLRARPRRHGVELAALVALGVHR